MTVPISVAGPMGSPNFQAAVLVTSFSTKASYTFSTTIALEQAEHFWPWKPKAEAATPSTAASTSVSLSTTIESLPPISAITRLTQICPGTCLAASSLILRPTSFEPVKAT